ncbi:MAG: hypothetical protein LBP39_02255 [Rickettsiales bacterium]|jgi:predicted outer membrane repeat protein|nr:hypothetical protein [Rickettsiales bacterium]
MNNKKINCSRMAAGYLFLGTLAIFIGLGAGLCLADTADVNDYSGLGKAIGDNSISTINIKADSIRLDWKLPVINHKLTILGKTDRKGILDGNSAQRILEFNQNLADITINNIHFQNGRDIHFQNGRTKNRYGGNDGGGAIYIKEGTTILFNNVDFSDNQVTHDGGAILALGNKKSKNILRFGRKTIFTRNENTYGFGGAIYEECSELTFGGETKFENNKSKNNGGAICSRGNGQNQNILRFNSRTIFTDNESTRDSGGAILAWHSDLIFDGETKFEKNKSRDDGGAIFSWKRPFVWRLNDNDDDINNNNILTFSEKIIFTDNGSTEGGGGAIYARYSDLTFGKEAEFTNNNSRKSGGAIYSEGDREIIDALIFNGKAIFARNESIESSGGAIYAKLSNLIFSEETRFESNRSNDNGGALYAEHSHLIFGGDTRFEENKSKENGGAIYAKHSDLTFRGEVKFENNSSSANGGAISLNIMANVIFNRLATFERNSSKLGGAVYLGGNVNMTFNSGLKLIDNTTEEEKSGAIHMAGEDRGRRARVTIVQKDTNQLTELRGNRSNNDQGHNAFYLEKHAELNFILKNGNVDLYDTIDGDRTKNSNTVALEGGSGGQFNLKEGSSINNVNLVNYGGNLNMAGSQITSRPVNFRNSGKITFGIFPENNICSRIQAENIALEEGTTLELVAAEGTYEAGHNYDIMVSNNVIKRPENINIILPQTLPRGLRAKADFQDKFYRLLIVKDSEDIEDNDESYCD